MEVIPLFIYLFIFRKTGPRNFIEALAELGFAASVVVNSQGNTMKESLTRKKEISVWKYVYYEINFCI